MSAIAAQVNYEHNYQTLMHLSRGRISIDNRTTQRRIVVHSHGIAFDIELLSLFPLRFNETLQQLLDHTAAVRSSLAQRAARTVKPVSEDAITELRFTKKIKGYPRCTICMEDFKSNEKIWQLHGKQCSYHKRCLKKWFKQNSTCPNCGLDCA